MRQRLIKTDARGNLGWKPPGQVPKSVSENSRAATEQNKLQVCAQHFFQRAQHNIDPFLLN